jgi:hypothetical protein
MHEHFKGKNVKFCPSEASGVYENSPNVWTWPHVKLSKRELPTRETKYLT